MRFRSNDFQIDDCKTLAIKLLAHLFIADSLSSSELDNFNNKLFYEWVHRGLFCYFLNNLLDHERKKFENQCSIFLLRASSLILLQKLDFNI